jgi:glycosidase
MWNDPEPTNWQDATMYLAFTDRFRDTDGSGADTPTDVEQIAGYQGGDFAGVTAAINAGYFEDLGVNTLWLSPIYENPDGGFTGSDGTHLYTGYHGYWPIDPLAAETRLGGDEALHTLVDTAHANGIRIVMDLVLNHVHEDHPYCETDGWCSTTCVCGTDGCGYDERARDCQFAPYLPDLDYRNHELTKQVAADVLELVRKFDFDGLRIDAAKHMDHVIIRRLRLEVQAIEDAGGAPFWLIGETFTFDRAEIMRYVNDVELHGQFDFPLFGAIRGTFAQGGSFRDLEGAAAASQREYGAHYGAMSPFLGNHDVERFATLWAGNNAGPFGGTPDLMAEGGAEITQWDLINPLSMAFVFLLTQPGVPLIYYGDEVGLAGSGDPDNRRFMPDVDGLNANQQELLGRVQQIGQLRRQIPALRRGVRKELWLDDDMYVYLRDGGADGVAIVAMNKGGARTAEVQIPSALGVQGATFVSRNSDRSYRVLDGVMSLTLDPWEYVVLTPE